MEQRIEANMNRTTVGPANGFGRMRGGRGPGSGFGCGGLGCGLGNGPGQGFGQGYDASQ